MRHPVQPEPVATTGQLPDLPRQDRALLRELASEKAGIAALPVHREKAELWRALNDLESRRPMVLLYEVCWSEMNVDDELTLRTTHPFAQEQERSLRRLLYQWRHMPCDMIVDDFMPSPLVIHSSGFGIREQADIVKTDEDNSVVSRHFHEQIRDFDDLEKIEMPRLRFDAEASELRFQALCELYEGILPVKQVGRKDIWFTPWDYLVQWWNMEQVMMDMYDRPELVHAAVERMVDAWMAEVDQLDAMNLLERCDNNTAVGSGGYGYTRALPGPDHDPDHLHPHNMWGCSNAQIFAEISPDFHWEFALQHDLRWLERWGLTYYGCCEPLHAKTDILRRIPNLRKISCSPWCDPGRMAEQLGSDYVMSRKPNPALLAEDSFSPERLRAHLVETMDAAGKEAHVEFIFKDLSTVRRDPPRLWETARIAMEVAEDYAS